MISQYFTPLTLADTETSADDGRKRVVDSLDAILRFLDR
jgi:hypothetical protein